MKAYNERPRRDKDACKNIFDALESVAKIITNKPQGTFGDALTELGKGSKIESTIKVVLEKLYALANDNKGFRHGTTQDFKLCPAQVDFVWGTSLAGIIMLARLQK